ncbi:MAG: MBL fold metallo-hydrolase [Patescibacteria group bacterium]|jgi:L-ascorbate metabolism protein UlaG (beta-lactamase superfamily)
MQIFWHGFSSIRIEAKQGETEATLLTDPYPNESGLRFPRTIEPDMLVLSHQDKERFNLEGVLGSPFTVTDPGEYEVQGMFAHGIQDPAAEKDELRPIVYRFDAEGISLAFLGQINRALTTHEIEQLGDIDILFLPVGGGEVLDAKKAVDVISSVEPRIVIPMYYDVPGIKEKLGTVDAFCKQMGASKRQDASKLKITKKDLPADDVLIVVLERA